MTNQMLMEELSRISAIHAIDLGHVPASSQAVEGTYYPQFSESVRSEASQMSRHYEIFYCLEKSIRILVSVTIETAENAADWWVSSNRIPQNVKSEVDSRIQREVDSGITLRSQDELDFTTFGELSVIINSNWSIFGGVFSSRKAVEKVMANLNSLRGPIAHCSPLAEDEQLRLHLAVRDWFRLME